MVGIPIYKSIKTIAAIINIARDTKVPNVLPNNLTDCAVLGRWGAG